MSLPRLIRRPARPPVLAALLLGLAAGACRGPDERPRPLSLHVDLSLVGRSWDEGPRRDAVVALVRRDGERFARELFRKDPMPTGMPADAGRRGELMKDLLAVVRHETGKKRDEPPSWWKGVPPQPGSFENDLPKAFPVEVRRDETPQLLAGWCGTTIESLLEENASTLGKRRWFRPGDVLQVTMSPNQKLAFDRARDRHRHDRLEAYFARHHVEKVVVHVVQRGDKIAKVAKSYGDTPGWLLEAFNQTDFRRLQPGDTVLIPVVAELRPGRIPPPIRVVDRDGRPLEAGESALVDRKMPAALLQEARVAIDDSNVFERPDDGARTAAALLPRPGAAPAPPDRPVPPALPQPRVAPREVVVKAGETLSHYAKWARLSTPEILEANPGLVPERLAAGQRLLLPLSDQRFSDFVLARAGVLDPAVAGVVPPPPAPKVERTPEPPRKPLPAVIQRAKEAMAPPKAEGPASVPAPRANGPASVPAPAARVHEVKPGETASAIAKRYAVDLGDLARANPGRDLDRLFAGDELAIPGR